MKIFSYGLLGLVLFCTFTLKGQPYFPDKGEVFRTDVLPRIDISVHPDTLNWLYDNVEANVEFHASFSFDNGTIDTTINNVGFRLRGNTSRESAKKSFKVSFNAFTSGAKFFGLEKMNLNGEHNDPSIIRSHLAWNLFESMQVVGARSNHVVLYINNDYYGVYINVEHIDEEFIKSRFDHNFGNLYKCLYPADMVYYGSNKNDYKERGYSLKTNTAADNYSDLIKLIKTLDETASAMLPQELEPIFNVNGYLRYLAVEVFTGHWDAYSFNKNNYYLYNNYYTGKIEFIPYDVDNTFSIDWFGKDWSTRNIYNWTSDWEDRPLTEKILDNGVYKDRYSFFLKQLIETYGSEAELFPQIDAIKAKIFTSVLSDSYRSLDYGWDFNDFEQSYTTFNDQHVKMGLKDYISTRIASINDQLVVNPISPIIENIYHNFPGINDSIRISASVIDDNSIDKVELIYRWTGDDEASVLMVDSNNKFNAALEAVGVSGNFEYYVRATDNDGFTSRDPVQGFYNITIGSSDKQLKITEVMASNALSVYDNYGQTADWIELKNTSNSTISLAGMYLSDTPDNRQKWPLPNINLYPEEHYLIWADGDTQQGENHASFKLSSEGEFVGLYDSYEHSFAVIDSFSFPGTEPDVSFGVLIDNTFGPQPFVTPKYENEDVNGAYVNFTYLMGEQINMGNFLSNTDYIDLPGSYTSWGSTNEFHDANNDGKVRFTLFDLVAYDDIQYKARINADWNQSEYMEGNVDGNRIYTPEPGVNIVEHWFNDIQTDLAETPWKNSSLSVSPNPATGTRIHIYLPQLEQVQLWSASGIRVKNVNASGEQIDLIIQDLSSGMYVVKAKDKQGALHVQQIMIY